MSIECRSSIDRLSTATSTDIAVDIAVDITDSKHDPSTLAYCSVVWSPYARRNLDKLDGVQRQGFFFSFNQDSFILFR